MTTAARSRTMTAALGVLALLAALVVPIATGAPTASAAVVPDRAHVLTHGHVDGFEVSYDAAAGGLVLSVKDDTRIYAGEAVYRAPETTTFAYADDRLRATLPPATGAWAFLGAYGGTPAWLGTQSGGEQQYAPWVGWSTERLIPTLADAGITPAAGTPVSLAVQITGPGDVFAFQNDSFGAPINRYIDTTTSGGGTIPVSANAHVHTNWVYTATGDYTFVVTPSVATTEHGTITGPPATYHVRVGDRTPEPEPVTTALSISADAAELVEGETVTFTAAQDPATELTTYRWEVAPAGSDAFVPVEGQSGASYARTVTAADDGARVRAVLLDRERAAGTAEALTLAVSAADPDPEPEPDPEPDPDPDPEPITTSLTVSTTTTSYTDGDTARFSAAQSPTTELTTYRWEVRAPGAEEFVAVDGATAGTYQRAMTSADDGARVRAVLLDGTRVVATSPAVTVSVAAAPEEEPPPSSGRRYVLTHGHIDGFETRYDRASEKLVLSIKDDTAIYQSGSAYRKPSEVTIAYEDPRAEQRLPAAQGVWSFLGEHGGTTAWMGTQTGADQEHVPWVGWSTERLLSSLEGTGITPGIGSPVTLEVVVDGPGDVFTFQNDSFGNPINRYVDTTTSSGGTIPVSANAHVHTNWVFTEQGDYSLTVTPRLQTAAGRTISGDPAEYHVRVGAYTPDWEPLTDAELTAANRGDLSVDATSIPLGSPVVVSSPDFAEGQEVVSYVYSEPTAAGASRAVGGEVRARVPASVGVGAHKLAVYDATSGDLLGWTPFTAVAAAAPAPAPAPGGEAATPEEAGGAVPPPAVTEEKCIPTPVTTEEEVPVLAGVSAGHFDFGSRIEGGQMVASVKDDRQQPPSWVAPSSFVFRLADAAQDEVPAGGDFAFLGSPGSTIWSVGQVQKPGVPWLGWNTQHPSLVEAASGPVTYTLDGVSGPGRLGVYATGNFGGVGQRYLGTMAGFPRSMSVPLNQHVHGNWAFDAPGVYRVTLTQSVPLASGGTASDTATLTFSVGDSSGTTTTTTYVGKTASGEDCELSAEQKAQLAATGVDPAAPLALVVVLLVVGSAMHLAARRRRSVARP